MCQRRERKGRLREGKGNGEGRNRRVMERGGDEVI